MNRKALGAIIFNDTSQREKLNEIVWPAIKRLMRLEIEEVSSRMNKAKNVSPTPSAPNTDRATPMFSNLIVVEAAIMIVTLFDVLVKEWFHLLAV